MADDDDTKPPESPWDQGRGPTTPARPAAVTALSQRVTHDAQERYSVDTEVARGGLGRILHGYDHRLARPVAIKELLVREPSLEQRFLREALITARLQHPAIVPIHDSGRWPSGDPYYAMKLVAGRSFDRVIRDAATLEARIALLPVVIAVCEALAYAHSERVIHRDLKPGNILVGEFGETVVIDWGLAKVLGEEDEPAPRGATAHILRDELTEAGSVMGTPPYMAPEQAAGEELDARADVYALGAILYHVLTGSVPYSARDGHPVAQVLRGPPQRILARAPDVPRELATIAEKAMARSPADRYPTAGELAEDLKRYQTGQLVRTHHYSLVELVRRFVRRHRLTVLVASGLLAVLAVVGVLSLERIVRERARARASANALRLSQARAVLDADPTGALAWLKTHEIDAGSLGAARALAVEATSRGVARYVVPAGAPPLDGAAAGDRVLVIAHDGEVSVVDPLSGRRAVLGDNGAAARYAVLVGERAVTADEARRVRLWDLRGGAPRDLGRHEQPITSLRRLGEDRVVTTALDGTIRVWRLDGGTDAMTVQGAPDLRSSAAAPDGTWIAAAAPGGVTLYPLSGGAAPRSLGIDDRDAILAATPRGDAVVAGTSSGKVLLVPLDGTTPRELGTIGGAVREVRVSSRGRIAVQGGAPTAVTLFDLDGSPARVLSGIEGEAHLGWSPDGRWLCASTAEAPTRLVAADGSDERTLRGHVGPVYECLFAGGRLVTLGDTVRIWELPAERVLSLPGDGGRVTQLAFEPGGASLAATTGKGGVFSWDPRTGAGGEVGRHPGDSRCLAFSPDGRTLVSCGADGKLLVHQRGEAPRATAAPRASVIFSLAFRPDGKAFASGDRDGFVRLWDAATLEGRDLGRGMGFVLRLAFSPDGARLVAATDRLLVFEDGRARVLAGHTGDVFRLAFRPDGTLATGSADHSARVWDVARGTSRAFTGPADGVFDVAFSPDGTRLAASSFDRTVRVWPIEGGDAQVFRHGGEVYDVAWAPDGGRIASASSDGTVRVWDLAAGAVRVLRHPGEVKRVAFSPDGALLASAGEDGVVRIWADAAPPPLVDGAAVQRFVAEATTAVIGADERPASPSR